MQSENQITSSTAQQENKVKIYSENTQRDCPVRYRYKKDSQTEIEAVSISEKYKKGTEAWKAVFGTSDAELVGEVERLCTNAMGNIPQEIKRNALMQTLSDGKPKDSMEAKLIAQAHVLFTQGMRLIACANNENMMPQQSHCMKFALHCLRLHNETVLTLDKLRRGGEQKFIVQHVNVSDGGQAAILAGNFQGGGSGK